MPARRTKLHKLWVENDCRSQCSSALSCRLKGTPLISSTVKNVEDIYAAPSLAVVDEVLPGREAFHTGSDVACRFTRFWMLSEQPEALGDPLNYSVSSLQIRPSRPIEEDLVQIPLGIL